jgi:hypothetical protein
VGKVTELDDPMTRASLLLDIASAYAAEGEDENVLALADYLVVLAEEAGGSEESIRLRLRVAPLFVDTDQRERSGHILEAALDLVSVVTFPEVRADLLVETINQALRCGENGRSAVRSAVDQVYVIEDPALRVETLISVADLYQQSGDALSVTSLIHQSVAAVRSVNEPRFRAYLFGSLARLAAAAREQILVERLIQDAVRSLENESAPSVEEERHVAELVSILADLGAVSSAAAVTDTLSSAGPLAHALIAVAEAASEPAVSFALLERALALTEQAETEEEIVDLLVQIGRVYLLRGDAEDAARMADRASRSILQSAVLRTRSDLLVDPVDLYPPAAWVTTLLEYVDAAADPLVKGSVAIAAAEWLVAHDRRTDADTFLDIARDASEDAAYLSDALRLSVVKGFTTVGNLASAFDVLASMSDITLRIQALTFMAVELSAVEPLSGPIMSAYVDLAEA